MCTSIEQSEKLLSLGLDPSTADMYYKYVLPKSDKLHHVPDVGEPTNALSWYNKGYTLNGRKEPLELKDFCIPCWSLEALLELMPATIRNYQLTIDKEYVVYNISYDDIFSRESVILYAEYSLIDAAFEMVCWLIEQKHIKVNK